MKYYIFVVDGEVAGQMPVIQTPEPNDGYSKWCAIMESNPTIVPHEGPVEEGYIWDGTGFTPPS